MRKSISFMYFTVAFSLIAAAILITSSFLIFSSVVVYKNDRCSYMEDRSRRAAAALEQLSDISDSELETADLPLLKVSDMGLFLFDEGGNLIYSENNCGIALSPTISTLAGNIISLIGDGGYFSGSTLNGFFGEKVCSLLVMLEADGKSYYLATSFPTREVTAYLANMIIDALILLAVLLIVMSILLRYVIGKILRPIKTMTMAAQRFGEGDFSEKIVVSDNSELGYLANSMNEMAYSLEEIEETRKSFISNVSHELKTPMTTIGGFVDGILDGTIPENMHRHYLKIVSEEVGRLSRLVRSMLNISKYESGEMELQTEVFDVTEVAVKTVLLFENRISAKKVDVRGLDSDRHFVSADTDLIQQVIYNLTENAVKFVDEGGFISYSFQPSEDGMLHILIRNSGEGLKKNEMNKVFDRFYKTDESRGKDKTGVGLGLSIVRSIVKLHNGEILVRSKAGEYTEFEFTLKSAPQPNHR